MARPLQEFQRFLRELKRRNVYKVSVAYVVAGFIVLQLASMAAGAFGLPDWFEPMIWVVLGLGFPIALVLAWAFQMTPGGVRRTEALAVSESGEPGAEADARWRSRLALNALIALGLLAVAGVVGWYLTGSTGASPEVAGAGGDDPSAEVETRSAPGGRASGLPEAPPEEGSIAVLPFATFGGEEDGEYFAHGLTEELIHALAQIGSLRVAARTSSFAFEGHNIDVRRIADSLDVATILEGSVQRSADRIRVTAQLIDGETGSHLGSWRIERDRGDVFQIQDEMVSEIIDRLEIRLSTVEAARLARVPTENVEAHDLYLRGLHQWNQRTGTSLDSAIILFRAALEEDPGYALAWAGLANVYVVPSTRMPFSEKLPLAKSAARRALELDPELAEARTALAFALMQYDWDWDASRRQFLRAMEDGPRYPTAPQWYAEWLAAQERPDEAVQAVRRAKELDPLSMIIGWSLAQHLYYAGRYEAALEELERLRRIHGDVGRIMGLRISVLTQIAREGDERRKSEAFRALLEVLPDSIPADTLEMLNAAFAAGGMDSVQALGSSPDSDPCGPGRFTVLEGQEDRLLECLRRAVESRDLGWLVVPMVAEPALAPIRDEPGYEELLRRVNLRP